VDRHASSEALTKVLNELRRVTGVDFSEYKQGTLDRQIARRQALTGAEELSDYAEILVRDTVEAQQLSSALLVPVSGFFRDPEAWAALSAELTSEWAPLDPRVERRIWVPGCATGEEAYSVAMVVSEILGSPVNLADSVKIFATDLREDSTGCWTARGLQREGCIGHSRGDAIPVVATGSKGMGGGPFAT
jgi:two-component system CheB/CheR fusion protein